MSLTKLFNKDFFIQNLKKSKSSIIFASIILPLFTALLMLLFVTDNSMSIDFTTLSITNIFFMYVLPVVLSISLFSFVYKKNSADFIGSMPISRKSIFTTNTIGGIAIIAILQIITAIIVFLMTTLFGSANIFVSMIWEALLYYTIAYIFVFVVCNYCCYNVNIVFDSVFIIYV